MTNGTYAAICPAIAPSNQLEITTSSLPNGTAKQTYSATLRAIGSGNYTWSLSAALPNGLALNALTGVISGTPQSGAGPLSLNVSVLDNISHLTVDAILSLTIDSPTLTPATVYSYTATYDHVGNVTSYTDQVMGQWNFTYDSLNRLASGVPQTGAYSGQKLNLCMNYDSFGNRTQSDLQTTACAPATDPATAKYSAANRVTWTTVNSASNGLTYDAAGNVLNDGANWYAYDGEGRVCAVQSAPYSGGLVAYGYIYDAEGRRVGKGTITPSPLGQQPSCNMTSNNFKLTESYVLGQGGEQLTTLTQSNGASTWQSTNVYGEGKLLATYDTAGLHFQLTDPLGTRRVQTNSAAEAELDCQSLPFGDQQSCFPDPSAPNDDADEDATGTQTPIHFTNKQHDTESGNDYFGARYYSSNMGRMMSPDWSAKVQPVPYAKLDNPQSLNLYSYVGNNPLSRTDPTGHYEINCGSGVKNCAQQQTNVNNAIAAGLKSKDQSVVQAAKAYGALGEKNGVTVSVVNVVDAKNSNVTGNTGAAAGTGGIQATPDGKGFMQATQVNIQAGLSTNQLSDTTLHEGQHVGDRENFVNALQADPTGRLVQGLNITRTMSEQNAYGVENGNREQRGESPRDINGVLSQPPYGNDPNMGKPIFPDFPTPY